MSSAVIGFTALIEVNYEVTAIGFTALSLKFCDFWVFFVYANLQLNCSAVSIHSRVNFLNIFSANTLYYFMY